MPRRLKGSISVSKPKEGKNAAMLLHLPHGLFNPAGVTMGIDAAKRAGHRNPDHLWTPRAAMPWAGAPGGPTRQPHRVEAQALDGH